MKSAQIIKIKEKLSIVDLPDPKPRDSQVLIRIEASGVCHSDIHLGKEDMRELLVLF